MWARVQAWLQLFLNWHYFSLAIIIRTIYFHFSSLGKQIHCLFFFFVVVVVVLAQFANENTLVLHLKISEVHTPCLSDFFCARKRNVLINAFSKAHKDLQWKRDMVSSSNIETWGREFLLNIFGLDNQIVFILEYFRDCLMCWSDHRAWQGFLWD